MITNVRVCYGLNPLLKRSDMAHDSKGITQFYLPPTHEPYLSLFPSQRTSLWLVLIAPTHGGGQAELTSIGLCRESNCTHKQNVELR